VLAHLLELNVEDVRGEFVVRSASSAVSTPSFFDAFSLVIAVNLSGDVERALAALLWERRTPLLMAHANGLVGSVRASVPELCVLDLRSDDALKVAAGLDLRIGEPFPALQAAADAVDLAALDDFEFGHVPYPLLLIKALDMWRASVGGASGGGGGAGPSTATAATATVPSDPKSALTPLLKALNTSDARTAAARARYLSEGGDTKVTIATVHGENFDEAHKFLYYAAERKVPVEVRDILSDAAATPERLAADPKTFWFFIAGLRDFCAVERALPVSGAVPDLTSTTTRFIELQKLYHAHAAQHAAEITARARAAAVAAGAPAAAPTLEWVTTACKTARRIRVFRSLPPGEAVEDELRWAGEEVGGLFAPDGMDGEPEDVNENVVTVAQHPAIWVLVCAAAREFEAAHGRLPGDFAPGGPDDAARVDADTEALWALTEAAAMRAGVTLPCAFLTKNHAAEIARFGGAQLATTAGIIGAIVSQEAVKIIGEICAQRATILSMPT
jgi:amyloid beta precursor protein binding protein 1